MDIEEYSYSLLLPDVSSSSFPQYDTSEAKSILARLPCALPTISSANTAIARRHPKSQPLGSLEDFLKPPPPPTPLEKNVPTSKELSMLIFAYSLSPHRPAPQWVKAYCRATIGLLPGAECQALANMLFALVRCGVVPDSAWTECWLGEVGPRLADFRVEELTQVCNNQGLWPVMTVISWDFGTKFGFDFQRIPETESSVVYVRIQTALGHPWVNLDPWNVAQKLRREDFGSSKRPEANLRTCKMVWILWRMTKVTFFSRGIKHQARSKWLKSIPYYAMSLVKAWIWVPGVCHSKKHGHIRFKKYIKEVPEAFRTSRWIQNAP